MIYNVEVSVTLLVEAPDEKQARRGIERYVEQWTGGDVDRAKTDAFESEPLDFEVDLHVPWHNRAAEMRTL